jgi:ribonuclease III
MIEQKIGYEFKDKKLLKQALTHPSSKKNKNSQDYERLEFLGDSVLGLLVSEILFKNYPSEQEGMLAKRRAAIVCRDSFYEIAKKLSLGEHLILGVGENQIGGRENKANLENALEALTGAIYLDGGIESARKFVEKNFSKFIAAMKKPPKDPKSMLQEWAQSKGMDLPKYDVISMTGPSHEPKIEVQLTLGELKVSKTASSRKEAEKLAAEKLLEKISTGKNDK